MQQWGLGCVPFLRQSTCAFAMCILKCARFTTWRHSCALRGGIVCAVLSMQQMGQGSGSTGGVKHPFRVHGAKPPSWTDPMQTMCHRFMEGASHMVELWRVVLPSNVFYSEGLWMVLRTVTTRGKNCCMTQLRRTFHACPLCCWSTAALKLKMLVPLLGL